MKELKIKVKIMSGDKLTRYMENIEIYEIISENVKSEIKEILKEFMNFSNIKASYIKWNNILKIYYVTDIDNCFKMDSNPLINKRECLKKCLNLISIIKEIENKFG